MNTEQTPTPVAATAPKSPFVTGLIIRCEGEEDATHRPSSAPKHELDQLRAHLQEIPDGRDHLRPRLMTAPARQPTDENPAYHRVASTRRETAETSIELSASLDGTGHADLCTGVGF